MLTEQNPADRQDTKPVDGSPQEERAPNPATPLQGPPVEAITFDDLYWRANSDRIGALANCKSCAMHVHECLAKGDEAGVEIYRTAWRGHRRRYWQYARMQVMFRRIASSSVIKAELARLSELERKAATVAGDDGIEHEAE